MSNPADPFFTRQWHKPYIKFLLLSGALLILLVPPAHNRTTKGVSSAASARLTN